MKKFELNLDWINSSDLEYEFEKGDKRIGLSKGSKYIRLLSVIASVVLPIAGGIYGLVEQRKWYEVILLILFHLAGSFTCAGTLIFLLKPILFFNRLRIMQITKKEANATLKFEIEKIDNLFSSRQDLNEGIDFQIQNYKANLEHLRDLEVKIVKLLLKTDRLAEWKWGVLALSSIVIVLTIYVSFYILTGLLVVIFLLIFFSLAFPSRGGSSSYDKNEERVHIDPWYIRLYNYLKSKEEDNFSEILNIRMQLRHHDEINKQILQQLLTENNGSEEIAVNMEDINNVRV